MKILSVNVGKPRQIQWQGQLITTGIFKYPVNESTLIRKMNVAGDKQADLRVHGGKFKAVYAYAAEHYNYWKKLLPAVEFSWGVFGENLTVEGGLLEDKVFIGDIFRIGSAELKVTQPRLPCFKLGARFQRQDMVRLFLDSKRTGIYFQVLQEGEIISGDSIELIQQDSNKFSVADVTRLYAFDKQDYKTLERAVQVDSLPEDWRVYFEKRLEKLSKNYVKSS